MRGDVKDELLIGEEVVPITGHDFQIPLGVELDSILKGVNESFHLSTHIKKITDIHY